MRKKKDIIKPIAVLIIYLKNIYFYEKNVRKKKKNRKLTSTIKILSVGFFSAAYLNLEYEIPPLRPDSSIRQIKGSLKKCHYYYYLFFFFSF